MKYEGAEAMLPISAAEFFGPSKGIMFGATTAEEQQTNPLLLNFDYSSIFDNKEALHNNSMMSGI